MNRKRNIYTYVYVNVYNMLFFHVSSCIYIIYLFSLHTQVYIYIHLYLHIYISYIFCFNYIYCVLYGDIWGYFNDPSSCVHCHLPYRSGRVTTLDFERVPSQSDPSSEEQAPEKVRTERSLVFVKGQGTSGNTPLVYPWYLAGVLWWDSWGFFHPWIATM